MSFTEAFGRREGSCYRISTAPIQNLTIPSEILRDVCTFDWLEISGKANRCLFIARSQCL